MRTTIALSLFIFLLGETVKVIPVTSTESKISIAEIENGIYFLNVKSNINSYYTQKLVIQH